MASIQAPKRLLLSPLTSVEVEPAQEPGWVAFTFRKGFLSFTETVPATAAQCLAEMVLGVLHRMESGE